MMAPTHTYTMTSSILLAPRGGCRCRSPRAASRCAARQWTSRRWGATGRHRGADAGVLEQGVHILAEAGMQNLGPVALPHSPKGRALGDYSHARHPRGEIIVW